MKKFIITFKENVELLEGIMEILESNGIIEVEEVQKTKKQTHSGIKVIAINKETRETIEFDSITQASYVLKISSADIREYLDTHQSVNGYYFKRAYEKQLKLK